MNSTTMCYDPNYVCYSKGHNSTILTNQNYVFFMHMSNAYLNCIEIFKSVHQILWEELNSQEQY